MARRAQFPKRRLFGIQLLRDGFCDNQNMNADTSAYLRASKLLIRLRGEVQACKGDRSTESLLELLEAIKDAWAGTAPLGDPLLNDAYHFANHYFSDEDIMRSNPAYAAKLTEQLDCYLMVLDEHNEDHTS